MTKRHDIAIQHSSKRSDWRTPLNLYEALDREFHFLLDVAADRTSALADPYGNGEKLWLGPGSGFGEDALAEDWLAVMQAGWDPPWCCFMNPPYSRGDQKADPPIPAEPIEPWITKAWSESEKGCTVVGVLPFSPQTAWYRKFVYGLVPGPTSWVGHAAMEVRQLPYRVTFIDPDTRTTAASAPGNTCIVIWKPDPGYVGPWQPTIRYWSYR